METASPEQGTVSFRLLSASLLALCRIHAVYLPHGAVVSRICRNDIDFVGIMLDAVKDCLGKRAVISAQLVVPAAGIILRAENRGGFPAAP